MATAVEVKSRTREHWKLADDLRSTKSRGETSTRVEPYLHRRQFAVLVTEGAVHTT
jgi:hypothetical protein